MNDYLPDPVDEFLQYPPRLPASKENKEALFLRTAQALTRPRRLPLLSLSLAAGVLLGVLLSYGLFHTVILNSRLPEADQARRDPEPLPNRAEPSPEPKRPQRVAADTPQPNEVEWSAFDASTDQERRRLYFQAGDLYLAVSQDPEAALRCYEQALAYCSARELAFDPHDNWLVMALKTDRRKDY